MWSVTNRNSVDRYYDLLFKVRLLRPICNSLNKGVRVKSIVILIYPFGKVAPATSRIVYAWRSTAVSPCPPLNPFFTLVFISKPACFLLLPCHLQVDSYLLVLHIYFTYTSQINIYHFSSSHIVLDSGYQ